MTEFNDLKKRNKLIILGFATSSRGDAPLEDDSFDVWPCNELPFTDQTLYRWDALFEMHKMHDFMERFPQKYEWLKDQECPIMVLTVDHLTSALRNPVVFPIEEACEFFGFPAPPKDIFHGKWKNQIFSCSISYMMAAGIMLGYDEIHLYGVDLTTGSEYEYQRPSVEWFRGFAQGRGIKVYVPPESALGKAPWVYGYQDVPTSEGAITEGRLLKDIQRYRAEMQKMAFQRERMAGSIFVIDKLKEELEDGNSVEMDGLMRMRDAAEESLHEFDVSYHTHNGAMQVATTYLDNVRGFKRDLKLPNQEG